MSPDPQDAPDGGSPRTISKDELNRLPLSRYEGEVGLIADVATARQALDTLGREAILGFDTESRPTFKKGQKYPVALLQLAGAETVYLFQLASLTDVYPEITALLENPAIIKAGVAIRDDIKKLQELHDFQPGGFVEIADISQQAGIVNTGLRALVGLFLGFRISKGAQVSNWSRRNLTEAQITYAATDAWVSRELYLKMQASGLDLHSPPSPPKKG